MDEVDVMAIAQGVRQLPVFIVKVQLQVTL